MKLILFENIKRLTTLRPIPNGYPGR